MLKSPHTTYIPVIYTEDEKTSEKGDRQLDLRGLHTQETKTFQQKDVQRRFL